MKAYTHLRYLTAFFLEWEIFQTKVVEKPITYFVCWINFSENRAVLWDNVEKYCRAGQATGENIIRGMRIAGCIA